MVSATVETSPSSSLRWAGIGDCASRFHNRFDARARMVETSCFSTVGPGNRMRWSISFAVARSNSTVGNSALNHALEHNHRTNRKCPGWFSEVPVSECCPDFFGMLSLGVVPPGRTRPVVFDVQLLHQMRHH